MVTVVNVSWDEQIILSAELNDTSYESGADLYWEKTIHIFFKKPNNQKPKKKLFFSLNQIREQSRMTSDVLGVFLIYLS